MSRVAELAQPFAQTRDRLVVRVEQPALGQERVHERVLDGAFDRPPELGARHQERVDVDAVGVERKRIRRSACRRRPSRASDRCRTSPRRYRGTRLPHSRAARIAPILLYLRDEGVERRRERLTS